MADDTRLPLHTESPADERLRELRRLLPEAFTEGKLDVEKLQAAVGGNVATGRERYGLNWAGKSEAVRTLLAPGTGTLRPCPDESVNFDTTENLVIEGDNLEVLKLLQKSYHGKVKLIYIDPPYNTGNDFIYADDFRSPLDAYRRYTGEIDDAGNATTSNRDTSGRFHSNWLNMMYPRLHLARSLLREDGVIFVSIDDNEVHNLRMVMNEVFGEENFIANIVWQKRYVSNATAKYLSDMHDHILVFGRHSENVSVAREDRTEDQIADYKNPDNDPRGPWRAQDLSASKPYSAGQYTIVTPFGLSVTPPPGRYWRCNEAQYNTWVSDNRIWFGKEGTARPMLKAFLSEVKEGITPNTWWTHEQAGHNKESTLEIKGLFDGESPFDNPKPVRLLKKIIQLFSDDSGIVLDFFGGSGTTAHAVLDMNEADGGNRKFILVQLPEKTDKPDYPTIAHITRERVRRVIKRIEQARADKPATNDLLTEPAAPQQVLGFRALRLDTSNFRRWDDAAAPTGEQALATQLSLHADHLVAERSDLDLLFELALHGGLPLSAQAEKLQVGKQAAWRIVHDEQTFLFCLANPVEQATLDALRALKPDMLVCLDAAFAGNDALKTNTVLQMKDAGIRFHTA